MIFVSNTDNHRITMTPSYYRRYDGGGRDLIKGVSAQFEDHRFDTEQAQKQNQWTDEQRESLENYLLNHPDLGRGGASGFMSLQGLNEDGPMVMPDVATCLFEVTIDGEVDVCGRPAVSEDGYCTKHAALVSSPKHKPNSHKETANA